MFTMCSTIPHGVLLVKTGGVWQIVDDFHHFSYRIIRLTAYDHGWQYGCSYEKKEFFVAHELHAFEWPSLPTNHRLPEMCKWKHFDAASQSLAETSVLAVIVDEPLISVTMQQGLVPRLFVLCGTVGGYISLSGLIFTSIFVKKYPRSKLALEIQKRTLFGSQKPGSPDSESDLEDAAPHSSASSTVRTGQPDRETIGCWL
ncbi:unnamed protein product [Symbiodinium sp. CCMP2456]|nr:unnamed protein product [Symbiodinium sp. CCMP2456]